MKIEYFVAPYEADAQLAYLAKIGYVDLVLTEDSDLLAFGCKRVLFKLGDSGEVKEINLNNLKDLKENDFTRFDHDKFLLFCITAGCDYFKIKGIGIKSAYQIVKEKNTYKEVLRHLALKMDDVPSNLEELFEKAFLTFKFQVIYCPNEKRMRRFEEFNNTSYTFINKYLDDTSFLGV